MNKKIHSQYRLRQLFTVAFDFIMYVCGLFLAIQIRDIFSPQQNVFGKLLPVFAVLFGFWILVNYISGLYDIGKAERWLYKQKRIIEVTIINTVVGIIFFYIIEHYLQITPKTILLFTAVLGHQLIFIVRQFLSFILKEDPLSTSVLFVGFDEHVEEVIDILEHNPGRGFKPTAIISKTKKPSHLSSYQWYTDTSKIRAAIQSNDIKLVVVQQEMKADRQAIAELYELLFWDVQLTDLTTFFEGITGRIPPSTFSESWFLDHLINKRNTTYEHLSRLTDLLFGAVISIIFLSILPLIGMAIKLTSRGPIFYKQKRLGKQGVEFQLYKFRSMYALNKDGGAERRGAQFAKKNDKRITPIGKFMRRTRIDELPQVINLLKGDLSIIGPRPERPQIVEQLQAEMPYYSLRHIVKPGLTGWAAVIQDYTDSIEESLIKLQYDLYYIKNRSFLLDVAIILKTINVVMRMMGR